MTTLLLKLFVRDYKNTARKEVRKGYGTLGGVTGILCNILLAGIKLVAGILSGSVSIIADAMNNLSDTASSVITLIGFKAASRPADKDHPFGHGRMEYMAGFIVSALILMVGFELFKSSVEKIITPTQVDISPLTLIILMISALIKLWMYFFNKKLGKAIASNTLLATARDSINDALTTSAILVSVAVMYIFKINIDAYVGLAMAVFILWMGLRSAKETLDPLLGTPPEPEMIKELEEVILSFEDFVGIHDLIVHNYGPGHSFASVHIEVPHDIDIVHCHEQVDLCEKLVAERLDLELVIHMDPIVTDNEDVVNTRAALEKCLKGINPRLSCHDFRMTPKGENRTNLIFDVVLPADIDLTQEQITDMIKEEMTKTDKTFCFVITFDKDFSGIH